MRITHSDGEHLVVLAETEASLLVDACALLVLASQTRPEARLPAAMATVLGQLFEGLRPAREVSAASDPGHRADQAH